MRLVSWNIQWGRGMDGRVDLSRPAELLKTFNADVICLQEVAVHHPELPGGADEDQPQRLAGWFPGYEAIYGIGSDLSDDAGGRRQFGDLILSRMRVLQVFRHLLPAPPDPGVSSMQRVAVEAVVATPCCPMRIITTHLEYYSALQRAAQIEALRALQLEGHRHALMPRSGAETDAPFAVQSRGEYSVFCGDFNFPAGAPEHLRMQEDIAVGVPRLRDAWVLAHPEETHAPTVGVHETTFFGGPACYDFFFVSDNLDGRVVDVSVDTRTDASDHQPVVLELEMVP